MNNINKEALRLVLDAAQKHVDRLNKENRKAPQSLETSIWMLGKKLERQDAIDQD